MKKTILISFFIFITCLNTYGQKEDRIWYFGGDVSNYSLPGAGLDFNSGFPVPLTNSVMGYTEGSAVQCDRNGSLLFYTNGVTVWDKTHSIMLNGTGLGGHISSEQSSLIIPFPNYNDTNKFYLFANDGLSTAMGTGLHYSIIDINLNGGLGAVTAIKDILMLDSTSEWLAGSKHSNGTDFWAVTTKYDSTIFYAYQISASGISLPIMTNLGFNTHADFKLDFNNKGNKVAFKTKVDWTTYVRVVADFDQNTGVLSNPILLDTAGGTNDGVGFSPNDSLLYCVSTTSNSFLFQYNLYAPNILASRQTLLQFNTYPHLDMKNAPDGKLYVSNATTDSLDRINFPNVSGVGCNYQRNAIYLNGRKYYFIFPNKTFEIAKPPSSVGVINYSESSFNIYPNPFTSQTTISFDVEQKNTTIKITDIVGKEIRTINFTGRQLVIDKAEMKAGIYFLQTMDNKKNITKKKIIIQ